jgi:CHAT domain-containing protein
MDEHLAGCSTCYEVFAETVRFALEEQGGEAVPGRGRLLTFMRRPPFLIAASLAAAGLLLAVHSLWRARSGRAALVAELAQAMGPKRFIEPRLTGGFQWGRQVFLRSGEAPQEGLDAYSPAVIAAVAEVRERAAGDTSPQALGALAVTYLVSGDVPAAVRALESATAQDPKNARLLSDLSAAYLVRATRLDEPSDLPKALDAAERSIEQTDAPVEAWFNRALALGELHLVDAARKAWDDYLQRDATSPWADEARKRRDELPPTQTSTFEQDRARARAALAQGRAAAEQLADEAPQVLRDYFDNVLLTAWADAYLANQPQAAVLRGQTELAGEALLRTTGDAMPHDAAVALSAPRSGGSRDPPRLQALGYKALHEAQRLWDVQQPACSPFREAQRILQSGGSPYAGWARERVVVTCFYYKGDYRAALPELARVAKDAERLRYVALVGRAQWMTGLIRGARGELTVAVDDYRRAREAFQAIGDLDSEAKILGLLAQGLSYLGEGREAWKERLRELAFLSGVREALRRQPILSEVALTCQDEGLLRAALPFLTASLEAARRADNPTALADSLVWRSQLLEALKAHDAATADLAESRLWSGQIGDAAMKELVTAEAEEAEGQILAAEEPERAAESLGRAIAACERTTPTRVPGLRLLLARSLAALGRDEAAEAELEQGIRGMESMRAALDERSQALFFDRGAALFDDMVALQLEKRHDPERALSYVERGRARQLLDALQPPLSRTRSSDDSTTPYLEAEALQRELPDELALVYYVTLSNRLVSWIVSRSGSQFFELSLEPDALRTLTAAHDAALAARAPIAVLHEQAGRLFDELVRPLSSALAEHEALVVIADGPLHAVPFASLWDRQTGRYLVEDHLLGLAPSGTVFVRAAAAAAPLQGRATRLLAIGNPRLGREQARSLGSLHGAEAEATEVAALYAEPELLVGGAATKRAFLEGLRRSQVVHFAGHAVSAGARGGPRLLLAPDSDTDASGSLYAFEIRHESLPQVRVVVLAACGTAAGEASPLEGTLSVARPFLAAGVPGVVASLWDVDDTTSRRFFVAFHRNLLAAGDPALALRETQISLLRGGDATLAHPSSWAGFVSLGAMSGGKRASS